MVGLEAKVVGEGEDGGVDKDASKNGVDGVEEEEEEEEGEEGAMVVVVVVAMKEETSSLMLKSLGMGT